MTDEDCSPVYRIPPANAASKVFERLRGDEQQAIITTGGEELAALIFPRLTLPESQIVVLRGVSRPCAASLLRDLDDTTALKLFVEMLPESIAMFGALPMSLEMAAVSKISFRHVNLSLLPAFTLRSLLSRLSPSKLLQVYEEVERDAKAAILKHVDPLRAADLVRTGSAVD